jgi:hypothetical protein
MASEQLETSRQIWIGCDVKGTDGKVVTWLIEGAGPNSLYRLGLSKESLPGGCAEVGLMAA